MITENEMFQKALDFSDNYPPRLGHEAVYNGYNAGYRECQSTIPSECIGFSDWVTMSVIRGKLTCHYFGGLIGGWQNEEGKLIAEDTEQLFNIYQEQTKKP